MTIRNSPGTPMTTSTSGEPAVPVVSPDGVLQNRGSGYGIEQTREIAIGTSTALASVTYPEDKGPTEIIPRLLGVPGAGVHCHIVVNAANDTEAAGFIAAPISGEIDVRRYWVFIEYDPATGTVYPIVNRPLYAGTETPVHTIHYQMAASGGVNTRLILEAV